MAFIDENRGRLGVEPICRALQVAQSAYRRHAARQRDLSLKSSRSRRDDALKPEIDRVWQVNLRVYFANKVWNHLRGEGVIVASCTVERLMRPLGIAGVVRGKTVHTTISASKTRCPQDRGNRQFKAERPNELWVTDFTYVSAVRAHEDTFGGLQRPIHATLTCETHQTRCPQTTRTCANILALWTVL